MLVRGEQIDRATLELLRRAAEHRAPRGRGARARTRPQSAVFHRPQQTFSPERRRARAATSGERFVLSQLDLIAYRNPGYFADADSLAGLPRAPAATGCRRPSASSSSPSTPARELLADALVEEERIRVVPPGLDHRAPRQPAQAGGAGSGRVAERLPALPGHRLPPQEQAVRAAPARGAARAPRLAGRARARRHAHPARLLAGARARASWTSTASCATCVVTLGPVSEAEKAWLIAHAGRGRLSVGLRGLRAGAVRGALSGVPCLFAPTVLARRGGAAGTATIVPWDPARAPPRRTRCSAIRTPAASTYSTLAERRARPDLGRARRRRWSRSTARPRRRRCATRRR